MFNYRGDTRNVQLAWYYDGYPLTHFALDHQVTNNIVFYDPDEIDSPITATATSGSYDAFFGLGSAPTAPIVTIGGDSYVLTQTSTSVAGDYKYYYNDWPTLSLVLYIFGMKHVTSDSIYPPISAFHKGVVLEHWVDDELEDSCYASFGEFQSSPIELGCGTISW